MGAQACSDAEVAPRSDSSTIKSRYEKSVVDLGDEASIGFWHEKMKLSTASQAVFEGAQVGDTRRVVAALNAHGDPNCVNFGGYSALMLAVGGRYREVVALLLQASADPNHGLAGLTPLMIASASGQLEVCRMLVNCGASPQPADAARGRTALHLAAERGFSEVAALLLQAGASVDSVDLHEVTPLMLASENGHVEAAQVLIASGASMGRFDKVGESALMRTARLGRGSAMEVLLKSGAPVNALHRGDGDTALCLAARHNEEQLCRRLLQFQASVNLANLRRETPLMMAADKGLAGVAHMLLLAGGDTTFQDLHGHTALMRAASSGSAQVASVILDFGGNASMVSQVDHCTPLTLASANGHAEVYLVLVAAGGTVRALEGSLGAGTGYEEGPPGGGTFRFGSTSRSANTSRS